MGVVWWNLCDRDMFYILKMVEEVKSLGLEICMMLGMLICD